MSNEDWKSRRGEVLAAQERALETAAAREHEKATVMLREAAAQLQARGIEPHPLTAFPYRGRRPVKTSIIGWYLKSDRSVGMDIEGRYFILSAPGDLLTRLRGANLEPRRAPLVVGRGGRDGEAINLDELLALRLKAPVPPARKSEDR